ncbi:hypothetical protein OAF20_01720 [bacterium]|nr:hypothetical protein [bacterium]
MKRHIYTLLLFLSFTPLVSKADEYGVLEPELTQKVRDRYISEILTVEAGEVFTPLLSLGSGSGYRNLVAYEYSANPLTDPNSSQFGDATDEGYLYQNDEVGEISQPIYGPIKLVILYNPPTNQSPSESKRDAGYVQYRISNLNPSDEYGVLEPELTQKVRDRYISEILTVEAGEVFTPLLSLGSGSGYRNLVAYEYSANPLTDPNSSQFGDATDEGYLYEIYPVGEISQPIYGPIKLVIVYIPPTNQSPSESKRDSGYVQYRISSQNEQLNLSDPSWASLAKLTGNLNLNHQDKLSDTTLEVLAQHKGELGLGSLQNLSDAGAKSLAKHEGCLILGSVEMSETAVLSLKNKLGTIKDWTIDGDEEMSPEDWAAYWLEDN